NDVILIEASDEGHLIWGSGVSDGCFLVMDVFDEGVEARRGCRSSITERDNSEIGFSDHKRRFSQEMSNNAKMDDAKKRKSDKNIKLRIGLEKLNKDSSANLRNRVLFECKWLTVSNVVR
ncbi:hypothetical protein Tco_1486153, partial [Tanacetum coccineum]